MDVPGRPFPMSATGAVGVAGNPIILYAIVVNKAVSGGTIEIHNGKTAAGTKVGTIALDNVTTFSYGNTGAFFDAGLWLVFAGSSPDVTVVAG